MNYYFYAPSFVTLREYLYLKSLHPDIVMVTLNSGLLDLAKQMKWNVIGFPIYENRALKIKSPVARKLVTIKYFNELNRKVKVEILNVIEHGTFYISCLLIDLWGIKITKQIAELQKDVRVVYLNDQEVTSRYKIIKNLSAGQRMSQLKVSLLFGIKIQWYVTGCGEYLGVDIEEFTSQYGIENRFCPEAFYNKINYGDIEIDMPSIPCLILGGYGIDDNKTLIDTGSIRKVLSFIKEIRPDTYHKYHPGEIIHDPLLDAFRQVPSGIPVEFLHKKINVAVSDFSSALVTLSNMGVKCISYLKLLETTPSFDKDFFLERMHKSSDGRIIIASTFDELKALISNH